MEELFDDIVRRSGGLRVASLIPKGAQFENADYWFDSAQVVAELKEIQSDLTANPKIEEELSIIYDRHMRAGSLSRLGAPARSVRIDLLPEPCRSEMVEVFTSRLQAPVKKAARQIKETKAAFSAPDASGLLILVNEVSTFLQPPLMLFFLDRILRDTFSSIDHVIYCSVNVPIHLPETNMHGPFWSDASIPGRKDLPKSLLSTLQHNFGCVLDSRLGVKGMRMQATDDTMEHAMFKPVDPGHQAASYVQPKRFYSWPEKGYSYYCDSIERGVATMYLVESYSDRNLMQAKFEQLHINASADWLTEITDKAEVAKLRQMLKKLRRAARKPPQL